MRRSIRTQITTRVVALSAAAALLLGATLLVLIVAVTGQRDAARTAFDSQQAIVVANQLENTLLSIESGLNSYVATRNPRYLDDVRAELASHPAATRRLVRLVSHDVGQARAARWIGRRIGDYDDIWATTLMQIAREEGFDQARNQIETDGGRNRLTAIRDEFDRLLARERAVVRASERSAEQRSARAIRFGIGGLVFVLVLAAGITLYLRRAVLRPVGTVAEATGRLAEGDLTTRVPDDREDELGDLARGFNAMADSLQRGRVELERSNIELSRSNAELEQFASVTSHDLQAPLTTISMYAELLERRRDAHDEDELELVDGIRGATQQARALIRDLLEYSRAGRGDVSVEEVAVGPLVEQTLEALAGDIEARGARIAVGDLPVVRADRASLARVVQNLVGNALKFSGEDPPRVSIEAERDGEEWRFCVRDNGIGMDPGDAERIFEPFQRVHGEEDYPGTGIGLAVCARIVDQLGGRIWVTSAPGEGSAFFFTLPAADRAAAPPGRVGARA